jgi:flagella basal body P-ring formation protein FlgA
MNHTNHSLSAAIVALLVFVASAVGGPTAEIALRDHVQLDKSVVRLGDVAEIVASDSRRANELAGLVLMPAPAPGTQRFVSQREIQDLLAAHGEDLGLLRLAGRDRVEVMSQPLAGVGTTGQEEIIAEVSRRANRPAGRALNASTPMDTQLRQRLHAEIETSIAKYLAARTNQNSSWQIKFDLAERHLSQVQAATTAFVCSGGQKPWLGQQRFVVAFATAEGEVQVPVYAEVARPEPVVVAIRAIERGATITAADVLLSSSDQMSVASKHLGACKSVEEMIGLEASRSIQPGDVITTSDAKAPLLVKRGEEITVTTQGGGVRVRTTARARQDGANGDLIQAESLATRDRFDVRVVGRGEAAVFTSHGTELARQPATTRNAARR